MDIKSKNETGLEPASNGKRPASGVEMKTEGDAWKAESPDAEFFKEEVYEKPRPKRDNSLLLLIAGIMLTLFVLMGASDLQYYNRSKSGRANLPKLPQILHDYSYSTDSIRSEITRYEKNLQRFFVYYDGFDPENPSRAAEATEEEIKQLKMEQELLYQQAVREINEKYNSEIAPLEESLKSRTETNYEEIIRQFEENNSGESYVMGESRPQGTIPPMNFDQDISAEYDEYSRLVKNRDELIAAVGEKYLLTDEEAAKRIEESKQENTVYDVSNYYDIKSYIENTDFFKYALYNSAENKYYTNIPMEEMVGHKNPIEYVENKAEYFISVQDMFFSDHFNGEPLFQSFEHAGIKGYIVLAASSNANNPVSAYMEQKNYINGFYNVFAYALVFAAFLTVVTWLFFLKSDKQSIKKIFRTLRRFYFKLPAVIKLGLLIPAVAAFTTTDTISQIGYNVYYGGIGSFIPVALSLVLCVLGFFYIAVVISHFWSFIRKPSIIMDEPEIRWVANIFGNLALVFKQGITSLTLSLLFLILSMITVEIMFIIFIGSIGSNVAFAVFVVCQPLIIIFSLYAFSLVLSLAKMNKYMDQIITGNFEGEINEKGIYKAIINKVNRLRGGVKRVVAHKNKSDKMKADLITNVSHDLKTPLTSIINYVELLKNPQLPEKDRMEYIDVLDRKSQRVQLLIEDLFEATKLSSGQITLDKRELNIVNLIKQAVGELDEKFSLVGITLKATYGKEDIPVDADGKKLFRVFENLFSNIIKYSQPGTRAYIDVNQLGDDAVVAFKNISSYEMNFEYDELFERFKRGDVARSTDGSGLGLSIAKDIVELHDGSLEISIDGDLFKVIMKLPVLYSEE